jgi:hypothetical protein
MEKIIGIEKHAGKVRKSLFFKIFDSNHFDDFFPDLFEKRFIND